MKRFLDTWIMLGALACSSSPTAPVTPPPPPVHARILAPHDTSLQAAGVIGTAALGYTVVDDNGAPLAGYTVAITAAPATWSSTATTFRPPLDTKGRLMLIAVKPAPDVAGAAIAADSVILDTASVGVTAQVAFKRYHWHGSWACQMDPNILHTNSGMEVDSMHFDFVGDTAYLRGDSANVAGGVVTTNTGLLSGTITYTWFGDSVEVAAVPFYVPGDLPGSVVDTLYYEPQFHGVDFGVRDTTKALPYYVGGNPCNPDGDQSWSHLLRVNVLEATLDKAAP